MRARCQRGIDSFPLSQNWDGACGKPATHIVTLEDGLKYNACQKCADPMRDALAAQAVKIERKP